MDKGLNSESVSVSISLNLDVIKGKLALEREEICQKLCNEMIFDLCLWHLVKQFILNLKPLSCV